jgi:hypothetical protein
MYVFGDGGSKSEMAALQPPPKKAKLGVDVEKDCSFVA